MRLVESDYSRRRAGHRCAAAFCSFVGLAVGSFAGGPPAAPITRLGAIGDSLTDEYLEESYSYARAWSEILVQQRGLTFGPTAAQAGVGFWGEPRRSGYQDNWARFGITTDGSLGAGAHVGLADGATSRAVSHIAMFLGGNDFAPWAFGTYSNIYYDVWSEADITSWIESRIVNYRAVLDAVTPTGARVVLMSVIDFSPMPYIESGDFNDAVRRERVAGALARFRDRARDLADEYNLAFLDLYALSRAMFGPATAPRATLMVGNVPINMDASGNAVTRDRAWVDDGIHPHTIIQGVWANAVLTAMNDVYGAGVPLLSEAEILTTAGLAYGGSDTLLAQIGPLSAYVTDYFNPPACPGDADGSGDVGLGDIALLITNWALTVPPAPAAADLDGSGDIGLGDLAVVITNWGATCP